MYVRREAVLSSQIEGTQSTLEDLLEVELEPQSLRGDAGDIVNYIAAMDHGLRRLEGFPLSLRLIREIHAASFVPPPVPEMTEALADFERFLHADLRLPLLVKAAEATSTAERIFELRERHRTIVLEGTGAKGLKLLSTLFQQPLVNVNRVSRAVEVTFPTANRLVGRFEELGLLREVTGQRRSRLFRYDPYLRLFDEPAPIGEEMADTQRTTTEP